MKFSVLLLLMFSLRSIANSDIVEVIGKLDHLHFKDFITIAYSYDADRNVVCVSATATRYSSGAATSNKCYKSEKVPSFVSQITGMYDHSGSGKPNAASTFKVIDEDNDVGQKGPTQDDKSTLVIAAQVQYQTRHSPTGCCQ